MKQSQKNIQIVKVQVGDLRKKRKARKKGKGKAKAMVGTGLAPFVGQAQSFFPPMFPTSRAGSQFEPPKLQVVEKKEEPLKDEYVQSLDQLKKLQDYMKGKGEAPSPFNVPTSAPPSPFEAGNYWTVPRFTETPRQPIDMPAQPLLSAQASTSSSSSSSSQQYSRPYLRSLTFPQLLDIRRNLGLPATKIELKDKEQLIEIIHSYKPSR